jgi:hypothetical protein
MIIKIITGIIFIVLFALPAIFQIEEKIFPWNLIAAIIDAFFFVSPNLFSFKKIKSDLEDANSLSFDIQNFVDRTEIYNSIVKQINLKDKVVWIRLYGEDGIGKKSIISKIFKKFKKISNRFFFLSCNKEGILYNLLHNYNFKNYTENNENNYLRFLQKNSKKVFLVFDLSNNEYNQEIMNFIHKWSLSTRNKCKLIIITYDNKTKNSNNESRVFVFNYLINRLDNFNTEKLVSKYLSRNDSSKIKKIVDSSHGHPGYIKYVCNNLNGENNLERLTETEKKALIELSIMTVLKNKIKKNIVNKICVYTHISDKYLVQIKDDFYVPAWIIQELFKNVDNVDIISYSICNLLKLGLIKEGNVKTAKILTNNSSLDELTEYLKCLYNNKKFYDIYKFLNKTQWFLTKERISLNEEILNIVLESLLQLGEYEEFSKYLELISEKYPIQKSSKNKLIFIINYNIADYYHLITEYDISNSLFFTLAEMTNNNDELSKIYFSIGHNFRHSGIFDKALFYLEKALNLCDKKSKSTKSRIISNIISIDYFKNKILDRENVVLEQLNNLLINENVDYNIKRHIANIYRRTNKLYEAEKILIDSIKKLEETKLRILQDFYFELAETYRFMYIEYKKDYFNKSLNYYNLAIIFAECNNDLNLKICSSIGKEILIAKKYKSKQKQLISSLSKLNHHSERFLTINVCILTLIAMIQKRESEKITALLNELQFYNYLKYYEDGNIFLFPITVM